MNKAQLIRDALQSKGIGIDGPHKKVQAWIAERHPDVTVAPAQVSNIRIKLKQRATGVAKRGLQFTADDLFAAKEMADQCGGIERTLSLLDILRKVCPN